MFKLSLSWIPLLALSVAACANPEGEPIPAAPQEPGHDVPLSSSALDQLRAQEPARAAESLGKLRSSRGLLGLRANDDFRLSRHLTDQFGITHVRHDQLYRGVQVWGAQAITHMDAGGNLLSVSSDAVRPGLDLDVSPAVTDATAMAQAIRSLAPRSMEGLSQRATLVVYPVTKRVLRDPGKDLALANAVDFEEEVEGYRLAWHVHAELQNPVDGLVEHDFLIDAHTGTTLKEWNALQAAAATGIGHSQYSGDVQLSTTEAGGVYELRDSTRGSGGGNRTVNLNGADPANSGTTGTVFSNATNEWGDGQAFVSGVSTARSETAGVDAHFGLANTWDYFLTIHGRLGLDGVGTATTARVHAGTAWPYDVWSDSCFCASFGDDAGPRTSRTTIDIVAHEFSHGVVSSSARLLYTGESGALNEATADIFATMTEFWVRGGRQAQIGSAGGNWTIGEQSGPVPLRYLYKPSLDGVGADAWSPALATMEVHAASGPMSRAFYFLSQGAQPTFSPNDFSSAYLPTGMAGIGNDKAAAIWYRAVTAYLVPSSDYVAARTASLQAASDLYGSISAEYRAVANAFAAINVGYTAGAYDDRTPPVVIASVTGTSPVVMLHAAATDEVGVTQVEFRVDGNLVATALSMPFSASLNVEALANGAHELTATAFDAAGNRGTATTNSTVANPFEQLVVDSGFEQGATAWVADPADLVAASAQARTGARVAWLNGWGTLHRDLLHQDVTIPAGATRAALTFWLKITTSETTTTAVRDTLTVQVRDPDTNAVLATLGTFSNLDATLDYVQRSFDLGAFAGQTVRLHFDGNENASLATSFFIDDVALRTSTGSDTQAPQVAAHVVISGTRVAYSADVSDDGYVGAVEFLVDGVSVGSSPISFGKIVNLSTLTNGVHSLVARATDAAGNSTDSAPLQFFVDATSTQRVLNPGFETSSNWTSATTVSGSTGILSTAAFAHSGNRLYIFWNDVGPVRHSVRQSVAIPVGSTSAIFGFWLRIYNGAFTDGLPHHTLSAKVRDSAGTELATLASYSDADDTNGQYVEHWFDLTAFKGQTVQLFFDVDQTAPPQVADGAMQFMLDDVTLTTSTNADPWAPVVSASVEGVSGMLKFHASVDENVWTSSLQFLVDGDVVSSRANPGRRETLIYDGSGLAPGSHTLLVQATDKAGNVGTATVDFDIPAPPPLDDTAPVVTVSTTRVGDTLELQATATDDTRVTRVEFYVDEMLVRRFEQPPFSLPIYLPEFAPGSHLFEAVAFDAYGHATSAWTSFVVIPVSIAVTPERAVVAVGRTQSFSATVFGAANQGVQWSLPDPADCGSLGVNGMFTAASTPATCSVVATSDANPLVSATVDVKVYTADLNGDGVVDGEDLGLMARSYGSADGEVLYSPAVDLDGDLFIDDIDVPFLTSEFGR